MKICDNPKLINDKAIDVLVDVARRSTPPGFKFNEASARKHCLEVLLNQGICLYAISTKCPNYCSHGLSGCGMYLKSK